ncbi:N-acetylneuraminate synthase family protein [Oceaniglobus indicus]|uniref:N-acetylneuraminate synthase family protein n=1 Tax=Oceaniglobus indicus TaxID=2047749 RepID=UPI000C17FEFB|nr:N-acetylneuraminate synthase family protein [Oceaniglobus indicus]
MDDLILEGKRIGPEAKPLLIAEVSANHDRDLDQALSLVDIAADAGWDCLKLQTYTADSLTLASDHPSMRIDKVWGRATLHDLYASAGMPMEFHAPLFARARERGLLPFTSIYDPRDLDFIEGLGCAVYKIASFEMTFDDLLRAVGGTGKPVILSTGMATMDEVAHALDVLDTAGSGPVVLLHCCSSYPAPPEQINLRAMTAMGDAFGRMVGFSDHTIGSRAPLAAAAMGAVAIEKHYTNDPTREGPDHRFSATPAIMAEIATGVSEIHTLRGSGLKRTTDAEQVSKASGRRSAFALRDLPAGHTLTVGDYRFVRPGAGWPANRPERLIEARLSRAVRQGTPITGDDLEPR